MSGETLREAVARAMVEPLGYPNTLDWERVYIGDVAEDGSLADMCRDLADAAIRTVLERLREPSEAMWTAGRDPILARDGRMPASMLVEQSWYDPERDCAGRKDGYVTKGDCAVWVWRAMLDAAAREVG